MVGQANASISAFTNESAWRAAVGAPVTTIGFEGIARPGGSLNVPDLVLSGIRFGSATVSDPGVGSFISAWGTGAMLFGYGVIAPATISIPTPTTAFGCNYGATACIVVGPCSPSALAILLSSGESIGRTGPMPPLQFVERSPAFA